MKNILKKSSIIFLALVWLSSSSVYADTFRCGTRLVKTGDTSIEVKLICGQPFDIEFIGNAKTKNKYVNIERYTYVPEKGKFVTILEFHDGNLVEVITGPRVQD